MTTREGDEDAGAPRAAEAESLLPPKWITRHRGLIAGAILVVIASSLALHQLPHYRVVVDPQRQRAFRAIQTAEESDPSSAPILVDVGTKFPIRVTVKPRPR